MTKNDLIESYYRGNYPLLIKIARRRVGDYNLYLAEEAVQEAFYRSLKYFRTYNATEDFGIWYKRILINTVNEIKWKERNAGVCDDEEREDLGFSGDVVFTKEILNLLGKQSKRNLDILNMYFFYQYKSREIAEYMNMSHDVVRDVIRTFRKKARGD